MCISRKHGMVVVAEKPNAFTPGSRLCVYSLADGSFVRRVCGSGDGRGQLRFDRGGLCTSPCEDNVLVADCYNDRVQEVRIVDGSWVRFIGVGVLMWPQCVACNSDVVVVSENCDRVSVLSWVDGGVRAQFGRRGSGPGQLECPLGIRLLSNGSELVVVDCANRRLCVFTLSGEFVTAVGGSGQGLRFPCDVLECVPDGGFVVADSGSHNLVKLSRDGATVACFGAGTGSGTFVRPETLAVLPDNRLVVHERGGARLQVFQDLQLRVAWIAACVTVTRCFPPDGYAGS
jgi:DNA-binding beta-propeller fold protein YncE